MGQGKNANTFGNLRNSKNGGLMRNAGISKNTIGLGQHGQNSLETMQGKINKSGYGQTG